MSLTLTLSLTLSLTDSLLDSRHHDQADNCMIGWADVAPASPDQVASTSCDRHLRTPDRDLIKLKALTERTLPECLDHVSRPLVGSALFLHAVPLTTSPGCSPLLVGWQRFNLFFVAQAADSCRSPFLRRKKIKIPGLVAPAMTAGNETTSDLVV